MARASWDTGWFQAEVYKLLLERLGYQVTGPVTMDVNDFYAAAANADVDLWANGWFPIHQPLIDEYGQVERIGAQVSDGALQGYLVDKATSEAYGITNLSDLADPDTAALFDTDNDGRADLIGCNAGWACADVINVHIEAFGLTERVEQIQGDYSPLMTEIVQRHAAGEPVLYYSWTPNWTVGRLQPGADVVWLQTPEAATAQPLTPQDAQYLSDTTVAGLEGCIADPCRLGWEPSDIQVVANSTFLEANPAVRRLLEQVVIPLEDILAQNNQMVSGEGDPEDIIAQAEAWIAANRALVEDWIRVADPNAVAYVAAGDDSEDVGRVLQASARVLPPFVIYEDREFSGFEVELARMLGTRMGVVTEIGGVDTVAKQIDDLNRETVDIALGGVAITKSRETQVDFSIPVLDSGLRIMVPATRQTGLRHQVTGFLRALADSDLLWLLGVFAIAVLLAAHLIWWMERRNNPDFALPYSRGIWDSFYWSVVTMSTVGYGDKVPRAGVGRAFSLLWIIFGTLLFAALTASIASSLAVARLLQDISSPSDLHGRRVATVVDTAGENYLETQGIGPVLVDEIGEAYELIDDGKVDAVVFDAPVLDFRSSHIGGGDVTTVGPVFETVRYGLAISSNAPELRERINLALLDMIESGDYDRLRDRWFGAP